MSKNSQVGSKNNFSSYVHRYRVHGYASHHDVIIQNIAAVVHIRSVRCVTHSYRGVNRSNSGITPEQWSISEIESSTRFTGKDQMCLMTMRCYSTVHWTRDCMAVSYYRRYRIKWQHKLSPTVHGKHWKTETLRNTQNVLPLECRRGLWLEPVVYSYGTDNPLSRIKNKHF